MNKRFPLPKKYWIYLSASIVFWCLLFGNIFRTNSWTGDMPFSEFTQREWNLFVIFVVEELILGFAMFGFALLGGKIYKKREQEIIADREQNKFADINPGDYDYIWFDFDMTERALILKDGDIYKLYVHEYDERTDDWNSVNSVSMYDDLNKLKYALFYEFDFYCEENAELDKHGDEIFKSTNE